MGRQEESNHGEARRGLCRQAAVYVWRQYRNWGFEPFSLDFSFARLNSRCDKANDCHPKKRYFPPLFGTKLWFENFKIAPRVLQFRHNYAESTSFVSFALPAAIGSCLFNSINFCVSLLFQIKSFAFFPFIVPLSLDIFDA